MSFSFNKEERLCIKILIDRLFQSGKSFSYYPFKIIYLELSRDSEIPAQVLISVSKRKFRKAVQRNFLKRRIREAYRHLKPDLYVALSNQNKRIAIGIIYISTKTESYSSILTRLRGALNRLKKKVIM